MEPDEGHSDVQFEWYRGLFQPVSRKRDRRIFEAGFFVQAITWRRAPQIRSREE